MKKKATLIATCVALPALLVLALSLTVFKADPPKETSGEIPAKTTVEQPVKEPKVDSPAEGQESTAPTEEPKTEIPPTKPEPGTSVEKPNPGETPAIKDPDENPDDETPSEDEDDRIPIASMALLTDETTGKGVISLGDHIDNVRKTLDKYELAGEDEFYSSYQDDEDGIWYCYGDVAYQFDVDGYLLSYTSWSDAAETFETSKGLGRFDSISKVFELYGRNYLFDGGYSRYSSRYIFSYEDAILRIEVTNNSDGNPVEGGEGDEVSKITCESQ